MKHALFFFAGLTLSLFASAQVSSGSAQASSFDGQDHIKITAAKDTLHINFKDKSFTLNNIRDLDSCLKKNIPEMTLPVIDLETFADMTPEYHRAIIIILDKYRCPVVSERIVSSGAGKFKVQARMIDDTH
jgi:hypothetical protein